MFIFFKPDTSKTMEQIRVGRLQRCAAICSRRLLFPNVRLMPLVSDELLFVIRKELGRKKHRRNLSATGMQIVFMVKRCYLLLNVLFRGRMFILEYFAITFQVWICCRFIGVVGTVAT